MAWIINFKVKMTICTNSPFLVLEVVFPLIITLLVYFLFLRKKFSKNWKQRIIAVILALFIFIILVVIGSLISIETGISCTGSEVDLNLER